MQPIPNRTLKDHRDSFGLLTTRHWSGKHDFDGGDTAHREGMEISIMGILHPNLRNNLRSIYFDKIKANLNNSSNPGLWRRHPDRTYWYGDWDRMSRDQMWQIMIVMVVLDLESELDTFFWFLAKRGGFLTNTRRNGATKDNHGTTTWSSAPALKWWERFVLYKKIPFIAVDKHYRNYNWKLPDFAGPEFWSIYFKYKAHKRGGIWKLGWIPAFIGEIDGFINSLLKVHVYGKNPDNCDDMNHQMPAILCQWLKMETRLAVLSRRYYFNKRPFAGEPNMLEYEVSNGPMSALRKYFDGNMWGTSASPPLDRLAKPLVNKMGD